MSRKFRVLIHLDELQRDYVPLHWIGYCLETLGAKVEYSTRLTRDFLWKYWRPHAVLDSHINYHPSVDRLRELTAHSILFLLPAEGLQFCEEHINIPYTGINNDRSVYLKYLNKIFLWGKWQKALLDKRSLLPKELAIVTGNPKYDGINDYKRKPKQERTVGIVGLFNGINIFDKRNFLSYMHALRNRHGINFNMDGEVEDFIWYQVGAFRVFMQLAKRLIDDGYTVSFRPHQLENRNSYEPFEKMFGPRFIVNESGPFQEWLTVQHVVVVMKTTSIYESFLMGVPIITTEDLLKNLDAHMIMPNYRIPELQYCWRPKSFDEAISLVAQAVDEKLDICPCKDDMQDRIGMYFDFPRPRPSSWEIAEKIYEECQKADKKGFYKGRSVMNDLVLLAAKIVDMKYRIYESAHKVRKTSYDTWERCIAEYGRKCDQYGNK